MVVVSLQVRGANHIALQWQCNGGDSKVMVSVVGLLVVAL